ASVVGGLLSRLRSRSCRQPGLADQTPGPRPTLIYSDPGDPWRGRAAAQQTSRTVTLSRRPSCGADSSPRLCVRRRDQAENVAVWVLEPCGFHRSGHVKIALPGHVRQVVMLEGNASALQGPHE